MPSINRIQVACMTMASCHSRETILHLHLLHFLHELLLLQRAELCLKIRVHLFVSPKGQYLQA